jgi:tellurite resistance protein
MNATERFKVLAAAALMDGGIGPEEQDTLVKCAKELGLAPKAAEDIISETREKKKSGGLSARIPRDPKERATMFRSLVDVVAADGQIDAKELKLFLKLGPSFGLNELEVEDLLRAAAEAKRASSGRLKKKS